MSRRSIRARTRSRRGSKSGLKASARSPSAPATSGRRTRSVARVWRIDPGLKLPRKIPLDVGVSWVAAGAGARLGDERARRPRLPDRSEHEQGARRQTDGRARNGRRRRRRRLGQRRRAAARRHGSADLGLQPDSRRRRGQPALPDRLRPPAEGLGNIATTHQMVEAIQLVLERRHYRAGAYTIGYQSCDDSTAQGGGCDHDSLLLEREGLRAEPRRDRHHRLLQLRLLEARDPGSEPGPERAAGDDQPGEHGSRVSRGSYRGDNTPEDLQHLYPTGEAELRSDAGRHAA